VGFSPKLHKENRYAREQYEESTPSPLLRMSSHLPLRAAGNPVMRGMQVRESTACFKAAGCFNAFGKHLFIRLAMCSTLLSHHSSGITSTSACTTSHSACSSIGTALHHVEHQQ
jgi:hypothetical protein